MGRGRGKKFKQTKMERSEKYNKQQESREIQEQIIKRNKTNKFKTIIGDG